MIVVKAPKNVNEEFARIKLQIIEKLREIKDILEKWFNAIIITHKSLLDTYSNVLLDAWIQNAINTVSDGRDDKKILVLHYANLKDLESEIAYFPTSKVLEDPWILVNELLEISFKNWKSLLEADFERIKQHVLNGRPRVIANTLLPPDIADKFQHEAVEVLSVQHTSEHTMNITIRITKDLKWRLMIRDHTLYKIHDDVTAVPKDTEIKLVWSKSAMDETYTLQSVTSVDLHGNHPHVGFDGLCLGDLEGQRLDNFHISQLLDLLTIYNEDSCYNTILFDNTSLVGESTVWEVQDD